MVKRFCDICGEEMAETPIVVKEPETKELADICGAEDVCDKCRTFAKKFQWKTILVALWRGRGKAEGAEDPTENCRSQELGLKPEVQTTHIGGDRKPESPRKPAEKAEEKPGQPPAKEDTPPGTGSENPVSTKRRGRPPKISRVVVPPQAPRPIPASSPTSATPPPTPESTPAPAPPTPPAPKPAPAPQPQPTPPAREKPPFTTNSRRTFPPWAGEPVTVRTATLPIDPAVAAERETKRAGYTALVEYRRRVGLGSLNKVSQKSGITTDVLRCMLDGAQVATRHWESVKKAIDELNAEET